MIGLNLDLEACMLVLLALPALGCRSGLANGKSRGDGSVSDADAKKRGCTFTGFSNATHYPMEVEGLRLLPVDSTGTGRLDLLVGGWWDAQPTFKLFTNGGDGGFTVSSLSLNPVMTFANLVVADFNRDGFSDLASQDNGTHGDNPEAGGGMLSTDFGDGRRGFASESTGYPTPQSVGLLATGDVDADGLPDLLFAGNDVVEHYGGLPVPEATNFAMNVYRNAADGRLLQAGSYASAKGYSNLVTGDFNGDGHLDIATDAFGVFLNRGDGTFQDEVTFAVASDWGTCGLATADFDGDGVADLVTTTASTGDGGLSWELQVLAGSRSGSFAPLANHPLAVHPSLCSIVVGDFNGDGKPDLAMVTAQDRQSALAVPIPVLVFENRGDGSFSGPVTYLAGGASWDSVTGFGVGDFNGDGVSDFAVATQGERDPYPDAVNVVLSRCE
jgi:hypothetical protein